MKLKQLRHWLLAATTLFTIFSCSDDIKIDNQIAYTGILISNEGNYKSNNASVDYMTPDLSSYQPDIYKTANNDITGDVLQTIGLKGQSAYLVVNNSNQITVVDRYTFKKTATVTSNLKSPRYIAFSDKQYYVTNNNFFDTFNVAVYNTVDNSFVKSIPMGRYAEKVVEASGNIVVQTDGALYNVSTSSMDITGHTLTIINPANNNISNVVTLPDAGQVMDLISYEGTAYALSSTATDSYIYKINSDGTYNAITLKGIANVQKLRADLGSFYFIDSANKVYSKTILSPTSDVKPLFTATGYINAFNVIDGRIFLSNANYTGESTSYIYNAATGSQIKTFKTGVGTGGFYKN